MVDQDIRKFYESVTSELISIKDRVRNLIGDAHWPSDGRYKEAILKTVIARFLPFGFSIGNGFVINSRREITKEIDLIIYDNSSPILFKEGDFVIVLANSVRAIIQVKTKISNSTELKAIISNANANGDIIQSLLTNSRFLFNGIFSYSSNISRESLKTALEKIYEQESCPFNRRVNHIALGENIFVRLWNKKIDRQLKQKFKEYELDNLSFAYFISNILHEIDKEKTPTRENVSLFFPYPSKDPYEKQVIDAD
ncbi:DUF6602 domain-containing protein [Nanoarchaeota archaeon]